VWFCTPHGRHYTSINLKFGMKEHTKLVHSCLLNLALINDRGGYGCPRIRIFGSNLQYIVAQGIQLTHTDHREIWHERQGRRLGILSRSPEPYHTFLPRHKHETTAVGGGVPTTIALSHRICENLRGQSDRGYRGSRSVKGRGYMTAPKYSKLGTDLPCTNPGEI